MNRSRPRAGFRHWLHSSHDSTPVVTWPVASASMRADLDFSELTTQRLLLRRSIPGDAKTIAAYRSDPDVHRYQGWDRTDTESVRQSIEEMAGRAPGEPGGWVQFSVVDRQSGV